MALNWDEAPLSWVRPIIRFLVIVFFSLILGRITEPLLSGPEIIHLQAVQADTLAAARAFNPWTIGSLYVCAVMGRPHVDPAFPSLPVYDPCEVEGPAPGAVPPPATLDIRVHPVPQRAPPAAQPLLGQPPQLGHWAQGINSAMALPLAFADVVYHLVKRPTIFATVFVVLELLMGFSLAASLGGMITKDNEGVMWIVVVPVGTVLFACLISFVMQYLLIGGLWLFGKYLSTAGLCCSVGGMSFAFYQFCVKSFEVKAEESFGELIKHLFEIAARQFK